MSAKYRNPMEGGQPVARSEIEQVVAESYDALCALAHDVGAPRSIDQTPYEYLETFPEELKNIREEAFALTDLYVRSQYSPLDLDPRVANTVRKFWIVYERVRSRYIR